MEDDGGRKNRGDREKKQMKGEKTTQFQTDEGVSIAFGLARSVRLSLMVMTEVHTQTQFLIHD